MKKCLYAIAYSGIGISKPKSRNFNFEIDDLNNDGITSKILNNKFHQNFLGEGRIYDERLRLKMMRLM